MGDFNEDVMNPRSSSHVAKLMAEHNYKQCVTKATTEKGTLIDHVYARGIESVHTYVMPTYYSYHEAVKTWF